MHRVGHRLVRTLLRRGYQCSTACRRPCGTKHRRQHQEKTCSPKRAAHERTHTFKSETLGDWSLVDWLHHHQPLLSTPSRAAPLRSIRRPRGKRRLPLNPFKFSLSTQLTEFVRTEPGASRGSRDLTHDDCEEQFMAPHSEEVHASLLCRDWRARTILIIYQLILQTPNADSTRFTLPLRALSRGFAQPSRVYL